MVCILSVYLLGLNFMPCSDMIPVTPDDQITQVNADANHDHQDDCSPFCQCHCCHVHVVEINPNPLAATPEINKSLFFHLNDAGWELPKSFLQPPRA